MELKRAQYRGLLPLPACHQGVNALMASGGEVKKAPYTARTSTTPGTALMAPAICGLTL